MAVTAILLEIPNCIVEQVVGNKTIDTLAEGTLSLVQNLNEASISLSVADVAFMLHKESPAYTHTDNPRWYFFSLPEAPGSYVKVILPAASSPGSLEEKLQDQFEEILIQQGMLQSGIKAIGDEIGTAAKQQAAALSKTIASQADGHISANPPTDSPATFSHTTDTAVEGAASTTQTASAYTTRAAEVFANVTIGIGEKVAKLLGGPPQDAPRQVDDRQERSNKEFEEAGVDGDQALTRDPLAQAAEEAWATTKSTGKDAWNATKAVAAGVEEGTKQVTGTTATEAERVVGNDHGREEADLSVKAGETESNVKNTAKDVTVNTVKVAENVLNAAKPGDPNGPVYTV